MPSATALRYSIVTSTRWRATPLASPIDDWTMCAPIAGSPTSSLTRRLRSSPKRFPGVLDTGIYKAHTDPYVVKHVNFAGDGKNRGCHGHGTHVSGIAAAKDDTSDVVGVAPSAR